jgi:hypothetical protein
LTLNTEKSLLVRADFVLGKGQAGDGRAYKRWRRILVDALPQLLGCERRCPRAERVRLRGSEPGKARFSGWLRIPVERRPGRKRVRKIKERLRGRLEAGLLPIDGVLVKLGVRRCRRATAGAAGTVVTEHILASNGCDAAA